MLKFLNIENGSRDRPLVLVSVILHLKSEQEYWTAFRKE